MILWATSIGLWRSQWAESARLFDTSEEINTSSIPTRCRLPAATWGSLTGALANAAILAPGGQATEGCWILYRESQSAQVLPLIGESLCLNPTPWGISFSTDTQPTDRIEEIQWRGVVLASPLERTARKSVRPVLDLGNLGSLPPPVAASASIAETGLKKTPESILKSESETKDFQTIKNSGPKDLTTEPSVGKETLKPTNRPTITGMMGGEKRTKRSPVTLIAISGLAVLLVAIISYVWVACVVDMSEVGKGGKIREATETIIGALTREEGRTPDEDWWETLVKGLGTTYKIVPVGFKTDFIDARTRINELSNQKDPDRLFAEIKRSKDAQPSEPLKSIIDKIITIKTEFNDQEKEKKATQIKREAEKKAAQEEADKMMQEATVLKWQAESARKKTEADEKNTREATEKKLQLSIIVLEPKIGENISSKTFFTNNSETSNGSLWKTNLLATNIQSLVLKSVDENDWKSNNPVIYLNQFNQDVTNNGFCFLKKESSSGKVQITIISSGEPFTNIVSSQPIVVEKISDKFSCKLSQEIASTINLFTNSPYSVSYEILKPNYTAQSLENLINGDNSINSKLTLLQKNILDSKKKLNDWKEENSRPKPIPATTPDPKSDILDKAGETLSQGFVFKKEAFPEGLKSYSKWLSDQKKERGETSYKEYLHQVFQKIYNSEGDISYKFWQQAKFTQFKLEDDFKYFIGPADINPTLGQIQKMKHKERLDHSSDEQLLKNIGVIFNQENLKSLSTFINPPKAPIPPNYEKQYAQELSEAESSLNLFCDSLKHPRTKIIINNSTGKPILIFTSP